MGSIPQYTQYTQYTPVYPSIPQYTQDKEMMWWEYEPLLVYGCWRSRSPYQVAEPHPFSSAASKYRTGKVFHPTYDSYLSALCEGDYFYLGYKPVQEAPGYRMTALSSIPVPVRYRWTKNKDQ